MSSLVRRIEKRIMKAAGMKRFTAPVPGKFNKDGSPRIVAVVSDKDANIYGSTFPRLIPRKFMPIVTSKDYEARLEREERNVIRRDIHEA